MFWSRAKSLAHTMNRAPDSQVHRLVTIISTKCILLV